MRLTLTTELGEANNDVFETIYDLFEIKQLVKSN